MLDNSRLYELRLLVNGKPIQEYDHTDGRTYVEGRKKSTFEIEFINYTAKRVLASISVDGLSIMDGEEAGVNSGGYVVQPWERIRIPGWRLNNESVAKFVFEDPGQSYTAQSGKGTVNTGVIGCMVFQEKETYFTNTNWYYPHSILRGTGINNPGDMIVGGSADSWSASTMNCASTTSATNASTKIQASGAPEEPGLGTGFGSEGSFNTRETTFQRKNPNTPDAMMAMYYDNVRGLEQRGIVVRPKKKKLSNPNPFPGMNPNGCTPPPGWHRN